ncbi:non-hydrolyzing UDP-N-acetylglucosamine 2-epimerase [Methanobacterium paludis]|uniref:UDP-N-acetylglucosamine 2-epimerase n=1 Tax=Methanobacterium paludis (strain DSM 25820 / JCM 18151 / SWAN1) TaxID=868131 RepID=F6D6J1_METPW|nr:UDP-N-acetylglucosamine 2-epimerase (non-hydrolyzing) [Methanobacterium paludis]AEG17704.1 UDP-N-acetylglucosamine 2-epimerase [Methanobacterium paludis]
MKIAVIIGTRPEIIKMAPVIDEIDKRGIDYILIHTGQHYDYEMSHKFFIDLELKKPDFNIGVGSGSHGKQTAVMIKKIEDVLVAEKPDLVLVQGDTNAVLAGAVAASKLHIAVGHVEAGLRSYDKTMPEEINRQVADVASKLYFVPTEETALNLLFEGLSPHEIFITGNTIVDACIRNLKIAEKSSKALSDLDLDGDVLTLTMHRAENVDDPQRLRNITDALLEIGDELEDLKIIFPVHPRTVKNLKKYGIYDKLESAAHIQMTKPVGYLDFLLLLSNSKFIMTDSGGLQEEAITLNVPCMTLRYNTERPETVTAGGNILVGSSKQKIVDTLKQISGDEDLYKGMMEAQNPYGDGKTSQKILDVVLKAFDEGKLDIKSPEHIMSHEGRELLEIHDNTTVSEFEDNNRGSTVSIVFDGNVDGKKEAQFPYPDLNLEGKTVLVNNFRVK